MGASRLCFSSLSGQLQNCRLSEAVQPCVRKGHVLPVSVLGSDCWLAVQIWGLRREERGEEQPELLTTSDKLYHRREIVNS